MSGFGSPHSDNLETRKSSYFNKHILCASPFRAPNLNRKGWHWLRCLCSPSFISNTGGRGVKRLLMLQLWGRLLRPTTPSSQEGSSQPSWCPEPCSPLVSREAVTCKRGRKGGGGTESQRQLGIQEGGVRKLCYYLILGPWASGFIIWTFDSSHLKLKFGGVFEILLPNICCQFGWNKLFFKNIFY